MVVVGEAPVDPADREGEENRWDAAAPAERGKDRGPRLLKPHRPVLALVSTAMIWERSFLTSLAPWCPESPRRRRTPSSCTWAGRKRGGQDDLNRREHAGQEVRQASTFPPPRDPSSSLEKSTTPTRCTRRRRSSRSLGHGVHENVVGQKGGRHGGEKHEGRDHHNAELCRGRGRHHRRGLGQGVVQVDRVVGWGIPTLTMYQMNSSTVSFPESA